MPQPIFSKAPNLMARLLSVDRNIMFNTLKHHICAIVFLLTCVAVSDEVCSQIGDDGCFGTFPPGHTVMTPSYWAIGSNDSIATIESVIVNLLPPPLPTDLHGAGVITPSLENTVS